VNDREQPEAQIVYVFDAYCGWCYGFGPTVQQFWELNRGRIPFTAISGGLFLGERRLPLRTFGHIEASNARISQLTGATFGEKYHALVRDGSLVLDSESAAAGFAALREQAPDRAIELTNAIQRAFFQRGSSLSDVETFNALAREFALDPDRMAKYFHGTDARPAAMQDFSLARALGANAFPALLVLTEHAVARLDGVGATADGLTRQLDRALEESTTAPR
jgi:putative protein-disulfide isomerase